MKQKMCTLVGLLGGWISSVVGGWNTAIASLVICMGIDYVTGLIVAGVFHNSPKTAGGGLESRVGWKGLARKGVTLLIVIVAYRMDQILGMNYIRDAVVIGFCVNEVLSIIENAGLMGLPIPNAIKKAIDMMQETEYE